MTQLLRTELWEIANQVRNTPTDTGPRLEALEDEVAAKADQSAVASQMAEKADRTELVAEQSRAMSAESGLSTRIDGLSVGGAAGWAGPFDSVSAGIAGTNDGEVFSVADGEGLLVYRNDGGAAQELTSLVSDSRAWDISAGYPTRAALVADQGAASAKTLTGQVVIAGGLAYRRDPSADVIPDLPGWKPVDRIGVEQFGAADPAIQYALDTGRRVVTADTEIALADGEGRSNVILRGDGRLSGSNIDSPGYRRQVLPDGTPTARAMPDRWLLADHWTREATVRIVVLGDSLTTYGADALTAQDGLTLHLERVLRRTNPSRQIEVISRGIGAQRYVDIDSLPNVSYPIANRYPWYTDDQRPWLDYVADLDPHIVVLSSGMNDHAAFDRVAFESVVAKISAMASKPQIVIATNMAPNLAPSASQASFGTYSGQEGRDYVAGYLRSYADYHGYSLIDINRTFGIVRDGRDILDTYFEAREEEVFGSASRYLAPADAACRDFTFRGQIAAEAWTNPQAMSITISPAANGVVWVVNSGGFLRFRFYRGGPSSLYREVTSTIPTPTAVVSVEITVRGSLFSFRIVPPAAGADAGAQPFTATVIRHGGLFRPDLQYFNGGGTGPVLAATLGVGRETLYVPSVTDLEMWGDTSGAAARAATGGNGANHPTSRGASAIYGLHFSAQTYPLPSVTPYQIGEIIMARLDGTGSHGMYQAAAGERITPANASGAIASTWPPGLAGTSWEALGAVTGNDPAARTVLWRRIS